MANEGVGSTRRLSEHAAVNMPLNYVSAETHTQLISQNTLPSQPGEDLCCDINSPGCQVQQSHFDGVRYFDWEDQKQRIEDGSSNNTVVDDYNAGKTMLVQNVSGVETCVEYCPITLEDDMTPLYLPKQASYVGEAKLHSKTLSHWNWENRGDQPWTRTLGAPTPSAQKPPLQLLSAERPVIESL